MRPNPPTHSVEFVRSQISYDQETGDFRRLRSGELAGFVHRSTGYYVIKIKDRAYMAQRLAWAHFHGEWPGDLFVDHINGDKLDNRISNLRLASNGQNVANSNARAKSGRKGVYAAPRMPGKWQAQINIDGKTTNIGTFSTIDEAARAYADAARSIYGHFARF